MIGFIPYPPEVMANKLFLIAKKVIQEISPDGWDELQKACDEYGLPIEQVLCCPEQAVKIRNFAEEYMEKEVKADANG